MEAEHKAILQRILDRRIARSAERAMAQDQDLIKVLAAIEEREQADRKLALFLNANSKAEVSQASAQTSTSQSGSVDCPSQSSSPESHPDTLTSLLEQIISLNSSKTSIRVEAPQVSAQANTSQAAGSLHSQFESPSSSSLGSNTDLMTSLLEILSLNSSTTSVSTSLKGEASSAPVNANNSRVALKPPSTTGFVPSVLRLAGGRFE
ncbi:hypothetical protein FRC07_010213 [Ceratobasidium sp. 392]|nr:hypothetical protein FRC07_010213 [Ceratobasidium sp. 392]